MAIYPTVCFYVFSVLLLASAAMVVSARNPVHSVLFLIAAFFNAAVLFLIAGAEFLALILVIVYVGAVAVLFLFVVMMLDVDFEQLRGGFQRYLPVGAGVGALLLAELAFVMIGWHFHVAVGQLRATPVPSAVTNTDALGRLLYTDYILPFQTAGLVLLVAMIGAIVLTHRGRRRSRHQIISVQTAREPADTLTMVRAGMGLGVRSADILRPKAAEPGDINTDPASAGQGAHATEPAPHAPENR